MQKEVKDLVAALEDVARLIEAQNLKKGSNEYPTFMEAYDWTAPAVDKADMADVASSLSKQVAMLEHVETDENTLSIIGQLATQVLALKPVVISYMFNGNYGQAIPAYLNTLMVIQMRIQAMLSWESIAKSELIPKNLKLKLRSIQAEIDVIQPQTSTLAEKVQAINDAHETAQSLPTDLADLKMAKEKLVESEKAAEEHFKSIKKLDEAASFQFSMAEAAKRIAEQARDEATALVKQCEQAHQILTSVGLAAAFDQRGKDLRWSVRGWILMLFVALATGAVIGSWRLDQVSIALGDPSVDAGRLFIHILLSVISLGAPLWFAWLASIQIGQRFRLAEDYAFKASVAKAYEGYRKEAARLDETFEARLFSTALSRLEEPPLRLVDAKVHGSPWHELTASPAFQEAMGVIPALKEKFLGLLNWQSKVETPKAVAEVTPPATKSE